MANKKKWFQKILNKDSVKVGLVIGIFLFFIEALKEIIPLIIQSLLASKPDCAFGNIPIENWITMFTYIILIFICLFFLNKLIDKS